MLTLLLCSNKHSFTLVWFIFLGLIFFRFNIEGIFIDICLPKTKPILEANLNLQSLKNFKSNISNIQECYLIDLHRVFIEMGLFDLEFSYCSRKTSLLNFKNDADNTSVDKLRSVRFSDYSDHICVNDAYEDFTN